MKKRGRKSKILVFIMSLIMVFTCTNTSLFAFAGETDVDNSTIQSEEISDQETKEDGTQAKDAKSADSDSDEDAVASKKQTLKAKAKDGAAVTVSAPEGALKDGAKVRVTVVPKEDVADAMEAVGVDVDSIIAYDITIIDKKGNEIQPKKAVSVKINDADISGEADRVYHINDSGKAEEVAAKTKGTDASFNAESFSIYVVVNGRPNYSKDVKT